VNALDTSVVVAALVGWHEAHDVARRAAIGNAVPAHVLVEAHAVLTRLPSPHRLSTAVAGHLLLEWFPPARVLVPPDDLAGSIVSRLVEADVAGGASYDALVGLTAASHGLELVTRDRRAARTYDAFGVRYELISTAGGEGVGDRRGFRQ
jgi:predicted nucleic acid-binding protein